ncbi:hypothetical protein PENVUL_c032G00837 [Penicillium vulpinum]|uniref:FAR1 domain-containing protein n=1 Tax=Penicillium vulpinum TaxID=29845 RepID=A0A1V6RS22_9EURO|nr:hypothetical protein PENVUL_c032G00837 [Penicillium vulpinum]
MASLGLEYLESDPDSDQEIVPESPPAMLSTETPSTETPSTETFIFPLPPIDCTYNTAEEGKDAINDFARPHGYAVTSRRSKKTKKGVKKTVRLICDHGRKLDAYGDRSPAKKRPNTTTIACECPFSIALRLDLEINLWRLTIENLSHNYQLSPASTYPTQRALELKYKKVQVETRLQLGRPTRQMLIEIREADPESALISRDIYNTRFKLNEVFLAGRTPIQALLTELPKDRLWIFKYELDDQSYITALFCIHKTSVAMLKQNPWLISIDCTYKTNRYGLPLLDIVGFAATGILSKFDDEDVPEEQETLSASQLPSKPPPSQAVPSQAVPSDLHLILLLRIDLPGENHQHSSTYYHRNEDEDEDDRGDNRGDEDAVEDREKLAVVKLAVVVEDGVVEEDAHGEVPDD